MTDTPSSSPAPLRQLLPGVPVGLWLALAAAVQLLAAWRHDGWVHPDEHYQILEFAWARLGHAPFSSLPWEFAERMRPAFQPVVAAATIRLFEIVGRFDPFDIAFALRVLSAVLGLWVSVAVCRRVLPAIESAWIRRLAFGASLFLWVLPGIYGRFSSETWGGLLLFAGLCAALDALEADQADARRSARLAALAGAAWALAFFCRFQVGFALAGIAAWAAFVRRPSRRVVMAAALGTLVVAAANVCLDRWFYGEWVLTPVAYFRANILHGKAAAFGTAPPWLVVQPFVAALGPLSVVFAPVLIAGLWYARRHVLPWTFVPFVVAHALVAHKELRFMNPMFFGFVPLVAVSLGSLPAAVVGAVSRGLGSRVGRLVVVLVAVINAVALVVACLTPVDERVALDRWLWANGRQEPLTLYTLGGVPYDNVLPVQFYRAPKVRVLPLSKLRATSVPDPVSGSRVFVLYEGTAPLRLLPPVPIECAVAMRTPPDWLRAIDHRGWFQHGRTWSICQVSPRP